MFVTFIANFNRGRADGNNFKTMRLDPFYRFFNFGGKKDMGSSRFFFFSLEEPRMHIHVHGESGEAKFWIEPGIELARNHGLSQNDLGSARKLIEEHENDIRSAWRRHFGG